EALNRWAHLRKVSPWFILWFVGIALLNSLNLIPQLVGRGLKALSRFLMTMALGAIGLNTDLKKLTAAGWAPMLLGFIVSAIVVVVSLVVQYGLGQI
ncbi:MAG TPA: putative sulfate exporter family transporter, partial [Firmicutes bacterium]|nr:putative sulfate exporter family transporter [Bacillota bacterium]